MGNPSAKSSEKWADAEEGRAGSCCPAPDCCAMRAERLGTALGGLSTASLSELAVELLPLSLFFLNPPRADGLVSGRHPYRLAN